MYYWKVTIKLITVREVVSYTFFTDVIDYVEEAKTYTFNLCTHTEDISEAVKRRVRLYYGRAKYIKVIEKKSITQDEFCANLAE